MGNINNLAKNWLNKEKHKDFKKHISAPFVEKRATFKGRITREQVQDAVQAYIAKGGQIQKLEEQHELKEDKDELSFQVQMSLLRRGLRQKMGLMQSDVEMLITQEVA